MSALQIRAMKKSDLPQVVPLATQLGYPSSIAALEKRFAQISSLESSGLFIAILENKIVGFMQLTKESTLMSEPRGELNAIVLDQSVRGKGLGREMIKYAEGWALSRGLTKLRLGSRVERTETHEFYKRIGFGIDKTWYVFSKSLS